jgi:hypothetical protein
VKTTAVQGPAPTAHAGSRLRRDLAVLDDIVRVGATMLGGV